MQIQGENENNNMSYQFYKQADQTLQDKKLQEILLKWGLQHSLKHYSYKFDLKFDQLSANQFLLDLFNSQDVRTEFPYVTFKKQDYFSKIEFTKLNCQTTKMDLFDKLETDKLVVNGHIKGCYEEIYEGIEINDMLRVALVNEDSEHYCTFNENDRNELLFRIFQILVLGGQLCQYEDTIQPYLDQTKLLYKSFVNARKNPDNDQVYIDSFAYAIKKIENESMNTHPQNVVLVIVNPSLRVVHILANQWLKVW